MSSPLRYAALDADASEIRILRVLPSASTLDHAAIVSCELLTVSLDDSPKYQALSYVWGNPQAKRWITVDGHPLPVTENLQEALQSLRQEQPRDLWVDAVCINQNNAREKETQLPLMGRIYANASSVLAWLGPGTPETKALFAWILHHGRNHRPAQNWLHSQYEAWLGGEYRREECEEAMSVFLGLGQVFSRPYWTRVWTFQEFWLSHDDPVLICGAGRCSASELYEAVVSVQRNLALYEDHANRLRGSFLIRFQADLRHELEDFVARCRRVVWPTMSRVELAQFRKQHNMRKTIYFSEGLSPPSLILEIAFGRYCTLDHDRVYSLFGSMDGLAEACPTDYTKPIETVMHEFAVYLANCGQLPTAMRLFHLHQDRLELNSTCPSWMPDLRHPSLPQGPLTPSQFMPLFEASAFVTQAITLPGLNNLDAVWFAMSRRFNLPPTARKPDARVLLSEDKSSISLQVRTVGSARVLLRFGDDAAAVLGQLAGILVTLQTGTVKQLSHHPRWQHVCHTVAASDKMARVMGVLFSTSVVGFMAGHGDEEDENHVPVTQLPRLVQAIQARLLQMKDATDDSPPNPLVEDQWADGLLQDTAQRLGGKVLFAVAGRLGMSGSLVEEGDRVVVAGPLRSILLLRPAAGGQLGVGAGHHVIGHAYVDGLMGNVLEDRQFCSQIFLAGSEMARLD